MNELLQALRRQLAKTGVLVRNELVWGYGRCGNTTKLHNLYRAVKLLRDQELVGEKCLCQEEIDSIVSQTRGLLGPECYTGVLDFTKANREDYARWVLSNPNCVSYEFRADYLAAQCKRIGIDFKVIEKKCSDVGIKIKITDEIICDAVELVLDVEDKTCVLDLNVKAELQQCIIDFETKVRPYVCNLDLKTYITELSCGADIKMVLNKYECAADIILDVISSDCTAEASLPCNVLIRCGLVAECDYFSGNPATLEAEIETYNNTVALPTIGGYCDPCGSINVRNDQWNVQLEWGPGGTSYRYLGEWKGVNSCQCYEQEGIAAKYCFAFGEDEGCTNACSDTYNACTELCAEGDEACFNACLAGYSTCLNLCLDGHALPALNMCECGYGAYFSTDFVSDISTPACDLSATFTDFTITVIDSLGNTKECIYRRYGYAE